MLTAERQRDRGDAHPRARRRARRTTAPPPPAPARSPTVLGRLGRAGRRRRARTTAPGSRPTNRVTCAALLGVVALGAQPRFARDRRRAPGRRRSRARSPSASSGTPLAGRLRAKTGHIDGVVGLAGLIPPTGGDRRASYRFAFLANGDFSTAAARACKIDGSRGLIGAYADQPSAPDPIPAPR